MINGGSIKMTRSNSTRRKIRFEKTKTINSVLVYSLILTLIVLLIRVMYNIFTPVYIGVNEAIISGAKRNGVRDSSSNTNAIVVCNAEIGNGIAVIDRSDNKKTQHKNAEPKVEVKKTASTKVYAPMAVNPDSTYIDEYTDLKGAKAKVSKSEIQAVINRFSDEDSALRQPGVAEAYITASQQSGYDPVFLLALTACEAGWNVSYDHESRSNPYSIGMWDDSFDHESNLGDTFADGIIYGANYNFDSWYTERECHCLHDMQNYYDGYAYLYYASNPEWEYMVSDVMQMIYEYIDTLDDLNA